MRTLIAISAALLMVSALPATSRADTAADAGASTVSQPATPGCTCPGLQHRHASRPRRHVRRHARYRRHWWPAPIAMAPPAPYWPTYYNAPLPSPYDSAYDRAMTLHFRNQPVSGLFIPEPGYPPTPPVHEFQPYRYQSGSAAFQYDGLTGEYIALSQYDALRAFPVAAAAASR